MAAEAEATREAKAKVRRAHNHLLYSCFEILIIIIIITIITMAAQ